MLKLLVIVYGLKVIAAIDFRSRVLRANQIIEMLGSGVCQIKTGLLGACFVRG